MEGKTKTDTGVKEYYYCTEKDHPEIEVLFIKE